MKKIILVIMAVVGVSVYSNAQSLHFGAKGGVNFASLSGDDADGADGRTGFHIGLLAELGLTDKFSIQPEVLYSAQGAKISDADLNLDYVNIPVLAKYYLTDGLSIQAGPQFGLNVKDDWEGFDTNAKSFEMSGAVGLEYKIGSFFAQGRYNFGLSDVTDQNVKNSVFQLSVGFLFF
ncbi:Outer membrane protein beta-barrel domain-containing protein [Sinomicrobium oceani]|uniref:Outer membrane protein beta-barrel domain-containing protein n=1 Tax=Sinomicrobium oceani TaxID=1150368 RepID=A0A1K1R6I2_9FLAO|nr:porin family protein [Sinomicrobium oceani]SFW67435.1 Outer membrane protein beta-barrel domain-containing protein [Sinomicrobium oceani]